MQAKPVILLTNDDGISSPFISKMKTVLQDFARVVVVVPDSNMSGSSQSITINKDVSFCKLEDDIITVSGTPADCVKLAVTLYSFDYCISGINVGANIGCDVLYSGTLAAAFEASKNGVRALALSCDSFNVINFDTCLYYMQYIINKMHESHVSPDLVLSVNIPDLPLSDIKGVKVAHTGRRLPTSVIIKDNASSKSSFRLGEIGGPNCNNEESDFFALKRNYVSVSPLQIDMTAYSQIQYVTNLVKRSVCE